MKKIRRHAFLVTLCALACYAQAQQAQLISALIDGCASGNDGADEWVMIYSGGTSFTANTSNIQVFYGTSSPASTNITTDFLFNGSTASFVSNLNLDINDPNTCNFNFVNTEPGVTSIPAGSHILIFNDEVLSSGTTVDYENWCSAFESGSSIYVLFADDTPDPWPSSGLFDNNAGATRHFRTIINSNERSFTYDDSNWSSVANGNYLTWADGQSAPSQYSNYSGCQPTDLNALPIVLLDFSASPMKDHISINWTTAEEKGNSHFTIERSMNAMQWETVAMVSGSGSTTNTRHYEYKDHAPYPGRSYYRLSQTDFNGTSETFETIGVTFDPEGIDLKVFPNPSSDFIQINCSEVIDKLTLINTQGRVYEVNKQSNGGMNGRFDIRHLPDGIYRVLIYGTETVFRQKLIKN